MSRQPPASDNRDRSCFSPGSRLPRQIADAGFSQNVHHGVLGFVPNKMRGAPALALAGVARCQAEVQPNGSLDRLNHLQKRRAATVAGEFESPGVPAVRGDQAGPGQVLEHLGKKLLGTLGSGGQFRTVRAASLRQTGKVYHNAHAIVGGSCELHRQRGCILTARFESLHYLDNCGVNYCVCGFCRTQIEQFAPLALH